MAKDPYKMRRSNPLLAWILLGGLLAMVVGLLAINVLRPGRSPAEDARMAAAIGSMDEAQSEADARREEKRSASSLLN
ncbi:MAG: hypothetical protein U1C74_26535 [Phenylobacterium sp.]|uniref:hypothetical protein n=1 Tax=Brevundimonas sp. TaxID=1871086 RepID=UPI002737A9F3|nr:hypothetical protein [Brevundimonas sp.]MDP3802972.1 hypothetical protein [Brevundimonas sp.]MDZ4374953.1 hypothetical protein [Phenylobacterium sp.]